MNEIRKKGKEVYHLSLTVILTIFFATFCIFINVFEGISGFVNAYLGTPCTELIVNVVFVYLTVLIWVLYRRWKRALKKQKELEDIISGINTDVLLVTDRDDKIIKCNNSVKRMFGYTVNEILDDRPILSLIDESPAMDKATEGEQSRYSTVETTSKKKTGETVALEIIMGDLCESSGRVYLLRDNSKRKQAEKSLKELDHKLETTNTHLQKLVTIDPLTELMNRRGMEEQLTMEINRARRGGYSISAILLDCDRFKHINDTLGYAVGDAVLKNIGHNLLQSLRKTDHIARVGGDEFLILLPGNRLAEAITISEKLRLAVATNPMPVSCENVKVTVSLGVALLPYEISSIEEILSLTRLSLHRSKKNGKNLVSAARDVSRHNLTGTPAPMDIIAQLLRGDCFYAASQPIFNLVDQSLVGYELLGRCTVKGFEMPNEFFGFSMENNILTFVDLQCLKTCIAATTSLIPKTRFHLNLFPSTLLATPIENLLKIFPADREEGLFCVEISEQQFIGDPSYFKEYVSALKEAGILVAIDDLGFGRSSLESLVILEPDLIKIDRAYVSNISREPAKRRSLERMMKILHGLNAEHIAEGIENKDDLKVLQEIGVFYGQGYLWGKPSRVQLSGEEAPLQDVHRSSEPSPGLIWAPPVPLPSSGSAPEPSRTRDGPLYAAHASVQGFSD
jgi:diguanylate cyclase (GGDEF)-like protein/PAS domain S-box-containing protein